MSRLILINENLPILLVIGVICVLVLFARLRNQSMLEQPAASRLGALGSLRASDTVFLLLFACYVSVFLTLALLQHAAFNTTFDLAVYDNQVWNITAGNLFSYSLINSISFKDYSFDPLISALVPLYAIVADARTLLIAATIALASAAFPIYWYARKQIGWLLALAVSFSFFMSPAIQYVNLLNFHVIVLATPLLAFALFFLSRERYVPFLVCALLAMLAKEEVALVIIGFGIYFFVIKRKYLSGFALAVFGFLTLLFIVGYFFPSFIGKPYFHREGRSAFSYYGANVWQILTSFVTRPDMILSTISSQAKLEYAAAIFLPVGLIPLLGLEFILVMLPFLSALLLTNPNYAFIEIQYSAALLPPLYFALVLGLKRLRERFGGMSFAGKEGKRRLNDVVLVAGLLLASVVGYVSIAPGPLAGRFDATRYRVNPSTPLAEAAFGQIPSDAVVVAQEELLAHFSNRKSIYVFPSMPDYRLADYIVAERDRFFYNFHKSSWTRLVSYGYFETVADNGSVILLKRKGPETRTDLQFGSWLTNIGFSLAPKAPFAGGTIVRPIFYWKAIQSVPGRLSIVAEVSDLRGHLWAHEEHEPIDGLAPTTQWQVNQLVTDQYALVLPPSMPTGDYQLSLSVHPINIEDSLEAKNADGILLGTSPVIATIHVDKNKGSFSASESKIERPLFADMNELRLLGTTAFDDRINPGDTLSLGIYWRARSEPAHDYLVSVQLRGANGNVIAEQKSRPAMGTYKTSEMNTGEVLLDWHDLEIPSSIPNGEYSLHLIVSDETTGLPVGEIMLTQVRAPKY